MSKLVAREEEEAAVLAKGQMSRPQMRLMEGYVPVKPEGGTLETCLTSSFSEFQRVLTLSLRGVQPAHHAPAYCSLSGFSWLATNYCGIPGPSGPHPQCFMALGKKTTYRVYKLEANRDL